MPLGLDYPYWVDDEDFDLHFHVRELGLAAPGSDEQLAEQVARIVSRPLDRARPLWELYLISGLQSGHLALLTKIHHAVIDGMSGAEILGLLIDLTPEVRTLETNGPWGDNEAVPGELGMLARGIAGAARYPLRALTALPWALPNLEETQFKAIPGLAALGRLVNSAQHAIMRQEGPVHARRSSRPRRASAGASRRTGASRSAAVARRRQGRQERARLHRQRRNRLDLRRRGAPLAGGARRAARGPARRADPRLRAHRGADRHVRQRIMLTAAPLHTEIADPTTRLRRTHDSLGDMKQRHRALPASLLGDANHFIPPAVFSRAARLTFAIATSRPGRPVWNLVISNVPGPQFPLYCSGATLVANYPVSVIAHGMGLNITVMSYMGELDFGIVADRGQVPDVALLIGWLRDELELLMPAPAPAAKAAGRRRAKAKADVPA